MNDNNLILSLLTEYQSWSKDRVDNLPRAQCVVEDMMSLATMKNKAMAVEFLICEDWCDKKTKAKELVEAVWTYREPIDKLRKIAYIQQSIGL